MVSAYSEPAKGLPEQALPLRKLEQKKMNNNLYDVVAVNIVTGIVRVMDTDKSHEDADACVRMAVARRGVNEEFFSETIHGQYKNGDKWEGNGGVKPYEAETAGDPPRIQKIGNMWYPIGPRGLDG